MRALFFLLLSFCLMGLDLHNKRFHHFRANLAITVSPLQYAVDLPIKIINWIITDVTSHTRLLKDNMHLRTRLTFLQSELQKQRVIEMENKQLHELLKSRATLVNRVVEAQILAVASDVFVDQIVINKGKKDNLYIGQPVLDSNGIMGQIVQIGLLSSRVMLITDSHSAIPVQDGRTGLRSILIGNGNLNLLKLKAVPNTADVQPGDMLISSGLGQRYPYGYPVGKVLFVDHNPTRSFADISVEPSAHLNNTRLVLLIWPKHIKIDSDIKNALAWISKNRGNSVYD